MKNQSVESFRDQPHISYSQINTYMLCPLRYYFQYVAALQPEFTPAALSFGSSIHEALAYFYRGLRDFRKRYSRDAVCEAFRTDWLARNDCDEIRFDADDNRESILDKGISMLKVFYDSVQPGEVLAVEAPFCLKNGNGTKPLPLPIVGSIDLIERDSEGRIVAVDHKTASRRYSDSKTEDALQLTVYTYALAHSPLVNGDKAFHARFDVITKARSPELIRYPTTRNTDDHRRLIKLIREVLVAIDSGSFFPITGWMCGSCPYQTACKEW
ncbi:PD-(D/E)XK nuclease family protein [bacterium]|nr:PD-(D/E)XK nuclease family protein [candidate division CSSED10-310 bacterium]